MRVLLLSLIPVLCALPLLAGFAATDVFLPAVGRVSGVGGAEFYTTVWITNASATDPVEVSLRFLRSGGPNFAPPSATLTLAPRETRVLENVTETLFASPGVLGALRVVSTGDVLVASRIYNQRPGSPARDTHGLFFNGVPADLALGAGESALIQGVSQGDAFRSNFFAVETTGQDATLRVALRDDRGGVIAQKDYPLGAYQQMLAPVTDVLAGFQAPNATLEVTLVAGPGAVIVAASQTANQSQDGSGFEMSFRSPATIEAGPNITIDRAGNTLKISAAGSISGIAAGAGLTGGGTTGDVTLGIADRGVLSRHIALGQVVKSVNGITDGVTIDGGPNVTVARAGSTLTISAAVTNPGVVHNDQLEGAGTTASPLSIRVPLILRSFSGADAPLAVQNHADGTALFAFSQAGLGVFGQVNSGAAVVGQVLTSGPNRRAGVFFGPVDVTGTLTKAAGSFRIDHPLDPENKYLSHSFVESPDMMNIYNGNVVLDGLGDAVIELPEWFPALNRDFRYQLTSIGAPSPNLHVAEEIEDNRFRIAGGTPGVKVSWQVTGIRQDRYAQEHPIAVEELKPETERGRFLHPELYGLPRERAIGPAGAIQPR
jgi:hypothetical protein